MASIRRQGDVLEIRECRTTDRGPRQRALARFRGPLTPEVLDEAAAAAQRPIDRAALIEAARRKGVPVSLERRQAEARVLLRQLRAGHGLDPSLVTQLREALALLPSAPVPPHLADAADWLGQPEAVRGRALRGLLRTAGRVLRSRGPVHEPVAMPFPRFSSADRSA